MRKLICKLFGHKHIKFRYQKRAILFCLRCETGEKTTMTKYHKHKLDLIRETCNSERLTVCCLRSVKSKYDKYDKLLKCVKWHSQCGDEGETAKACLKEIGEVE